MNNPTATAITHVLNNKLEFPFCNGVDDLLIVSLGNGEIYNGSIARKSATSFIKIAREGVSDMVDQAVSMVFREAKTGDDYVRIQANGSVASVDQMLRQKNLESALFEGKKLVEITNLDKLESISGELIKEHERRKTGILSAVVLKQAAGGSPRTSSVRSSSTLSSE